ncbi:MAG: lytic transglycosylase domain-containing protein [Alphaproteobacteria bacterium]
MAQSSLDRPPPFDQWLREAQAEALRMGISAGTISAAMTDIELVPRIIELDRKQPESTMNFEQYKAKIIDSTRIARGRALYREHLPELQQVSQRYGVQPQYIVALWGIETNFGENMGTYNVIEALATLAYDGRRSDFFRKEMFSALKIIDAGHIESYDMVGSWAGAMGQCQFMPSSFENFAVDGNDDGRIDIWNDTDDVFASIANYLSQSGWKSDETWGMPVTLPSGFDASIASIDSPASIRELNKWGVTQPDGTLLPDNGSEAWLVFIESDARRHPLLIYSNYKTILKWNRSRFFATAVGTLANEIEQGDL